MRASSPTSPTSLQLELRPSRQLLCVLILLAAAGLVSVALSRLPASAVMLAVTAALLALRRLHRGPRGWLVLHGSGVAEWRAAGALEPAVVEPLSLERRGPFAVLSLRIGGRIVRWSAASDTLPPAQSRLLRLWLARHSAINQPPPIPQGPA